MWTIKKILYYNDKTSRSYLLLQKTTGTYKTRNSDLLREWYRRTHGETSPEGFTGRGGVVSLGRLKSWLEGNNSQAIEDAVANLKKADGDAETEIQDNCIVVNGWLPTVCPSMQYSLELKKDDSKMLKTVLEMFGYTDSSTPPSTYVIKGILWMNRVPMKLPTLVPFIEYAASKCGKVRQETSKGTLLKVVLKKYWRNVDWLSINAENIMPLWTLLGVGHNMLYDPTKRKIESILRSFFDKTTFICMFASYRWIEQCTKEDRTIKFARLASNPERLLLQGEDYLAHASIDDYKRLLLLLGREIPPEDDLYELNDANVFVKSLKNRVCQPIESDGRKNSTQYIKQVGNVWATVTDVADTKQFLDWVQDIPLVVGYSKTTIDDIPLDTTVLLKHPDDKMQWWSFMSYAQVSTEMPDGKYIIGEAHNFSQEDWVKLSKGPAPLAICGRIDLLGTNTRGQFFYDLVNKRQIKEMPAPCVCDNYQVVSYDEAYDMKEIPTQVFVSAKEDIDECGRFPILRKMKRVWMYNPKRICTEVHQDGHGVWIEESDGSETRVNVLDHNFANANIVCTWESRQRVEVAVLIITANTRPIDVYRVRSYASKKVIFVEKGGGLPAADYKVHAPRSLIDMQ
jgi:hypothetical protein